MKKEFVSYEIALALKKLGFDERCIGNYRKVQVTDAKAGDSYGSTVYFDMMHFTMNFNEHNKDTDASAPILSQAFRFFREKYRLEGAIYRLNFKWASQVFNIETNTYCFKHKLFETYEEAEIHSLQKMIEIVKNKSV